jgi:hypothetical protein
VIVPPGPRANFIPEPASSTAMLMVARCTSIPIYLRVLLPEVNSVADTTKLTLEGAPFRDAWVRKSGKSPGS